MRHIVIPDAQVKPGVNTDHLEACGNYILEKQPDVIVNLGDFADMASLNSHEDRASKYFHDKSYAADIDCTIEAMDKLMWPIIKYNKRRKKNEDGAHLRGAPSSFFLLCSSFLPHDP